MSDIEWGDFKVILALSRGGSIAGASRILGVDSSTVSRRLAAAEDALGGCLVLRGGKEFRFTPEGTAALQAAEAMEASVANAAAAIKSSKQVIEGEVKITCVEAYFHVMNPVCERLHAKYPKLRVELIASDSILNLASGQADIAWRGALPKEPDLIARRAVDFGWLLFASKDYAKIYGLPKSYDELRDHRLILYTENRLHMEGFRWLEQYKSGKDGPARVPSTNLAMRMALSGAGIAALHAYVDSEHLNLIKIFPEPFCFQPSYLVYHESQRDSARIRAVLDGVLEYLTSIKHVLMGV
ncbi:MAG: LysR family transcriptional regulator [Alphaproteobacteria bacterium]|nr:LysR family transcriptional regulator [Alphaproteobacteria bacterium]